jgi:hypothetical protein
MILDNKRYIKLNQSVVVIPCDDKSITIMKSGWDDQYHLIIEYGDTILAIHDLVSSAYLRNTYGIDMLHINSDPNLN